MTARGRGGAASALVLLCLDALERNRVEVAWSSYPHQIEARLAPES